MKDKSLKSKITDIKKLQKSLKPGDIIVVSPKKGWESEYSGLARKINSAYQKTSMKLQGQYGHSGIYVGDGKTVEAFLGKGVREYDLKDSIKDREFVIVRPKVSDRTKNKAVSIAKSRVGKDYSIKDLIYSGKNLLLPKHIAAKVDSGKSNTDSFTCATLVSDSYQKAGARVVDTASALATPIDMISSHTNQIINMTQLPNETKVLTESAKKARRRLNIAAKKMGMKTAGSFSMSQGHSSLSVNGDTRFSGFKQVSNGSRRGVRYSGRKKPDGTLTAKLEKMGGFISPSRLQRLGNQTFNAYGTRASLRGAGVDPDEYLVKGSRRGLDYSKKSLEYSRDKYRQYRSRGFKKEASADIVLHSDSRLQIMAHPEVCDWKPSDDVIEKLSESLHRPMCIRIFPRHMVFDVYNAEHPCPLGPDDYYKFRAYTSGAKATVFVDDTETMDSSLWVILHELAHMDMKASSYLFKAYTWATPPDYHESDEAHERDPEEKMANLVATKWLGKLGREEFCYDRPWWRSRVEQKCSMEKDAGAGFNMTLKMLSKHLKSRKRKKSKGTEKHAANILSLALGVAVGSVAVYDYFRSRGMETVTKTVESEMVKNSVDAVKYVKSKDPRIKVITNPQQAQQFLKEIKNPRDREMTKMQLNNFFSKKESNAFAFRGKHEYVITHPRCNKLVLDHEIGHIHDFRSKNIDMSSGEPDEYSRGPLRQMLFKKNFQEGTYRGEVAAWDQAKVPESHKLRQGALETYDKSFHVNRMSIAAPTAVGLLLYGAK